MTKNHVNFYMICKYFYSLSSLTIVLAYPQNKLKHYKDV